MFRPHFAFCVAEASIIGLWICTILQIKLSQLNDNMLINWNYYIL